MSKQITHVIGTFLISGKGAFLNSPGTENGVTVPKTFYTLDERGKQVRIPYVASQAWKRWLRETFKEENPNEPKSIIKVLQVDERKHTPKKIGTDMNPLTYAEDDIFGYMRTLGKDDDNCDDTDSQEIVDPDSVDEENDTIKRSVKDKSKNSFAAKPLIRTSPFQASILTSIRKVSSRTEDVGWVRPTGAAQEIIDNNTQYTMDSLGYKTEFYDTNLQGIFGLAYYRLGVFRNEGDRIELDVELERTYLSEGLIKKIDNERRIYEVVDNKRKDRTSKILQALVNMRGGAKQTAFASPVHPQVILLAGLSFGNLIFNNLFKDTVEGPELNIDALIEILNDYKNRLATKVYIGIRTGYLNPENEKRLKTEKWEDGINVVVTTPIQAVEKFILELPNVGLEIKEV